MNPYDNSITIESSSTSCSCEKNENKTLKGKAVFDSLFLVRLVFSSSKMRVRMDIVRTKRPPAIARVSSNISVIVFCRLFSWDDEALII